MKKRFTILIAAAVMLLAIMLQPTRLWGQTYKKVTSAPTGTDTWDGDYVFVYESSNTAYVWTGVDDKNCYATASISSGVITKPSGAANLTIASVTGGYSIKVNGGDNNGKYIKANKSNANISFGNSAQAHTLGVGSIKENAQNKYLKYNSASDQKRFRYYASGQQPIQLYRKAYTVTYNNNGGSGSMTDSNSPYFENSTVTTKTNTFTNGTQSFTGWNTKANGSGQSYAEGATFTITENTTLYAQWASASTVATPSIYLEGGTYTGTQSTTITCGTAGSSIYYTLDGTNPSSSNGTLYSGAITIDHSCTLKAIGIKDGLTDSEIASATYTIKVNTPSFTPTGGNLFQTTSVSITCETVGTSIYYTTDGTDPTSGSTLYSSAISVSSAQTIKAIAIKSGLTNSDVATATYTFPTVKTVAEARAYSGTDNFYTRGVVTYIVGDGKTAYIQDATAAIAIYKNDNTFTSGLSVGDDIVVNGKKTTYHGLVEVGTATIVTTLSTGNTVSPTVKTVAAINSDYGSGSGDNNFQSMYVKIEKATYNGSSSNSVTQSGSSITVEGAMGSAVNGDAVTFTGIIGCYDAVKIINLGNVEIVNDPFVSVSPSTALPFSYIVGNGPSAAQTFTVTGTYLTDDDIIVSVPSDSDFEIKTGAGEYTNSLTLASGDSFYVRMKSGKTDDEATYSTTLTIENDGADEVNIALSGSVSYLNVTYNGNGDGVTDVPTDTRNYTYNASVTVLGEGSMARTGYDFVKWNTESDGTGDEYEEGDTFNITEDVTLYAQWDAATWTLTAASVAHGSISFTVGGVASSTSAKTGETVTIVPTPDSGYGMSSFSINGGSAQTGTTFTMPAADVTVTATFTPMVTDELTPSLLDLSGTSYTSWSDVESQSEAVYAGQSYPNEDAIQLRTKNSESGIITTASGGKAKKVTITWYSSTESTLDVYGKNSAYESPADLYSGTSAEHGAAGTKLGSIAYNSSGAELEINNDTVTYIGLRSSSGAIYMTKIEITWAAPTYALAYDANGGTGSMTDPSSPYIYNTSVTVLAKANTITAPSEKMFARWDTNPDGNGTSYAPGDIFSMPKNDMTLYAIWEDECNETATMAATTAAKEYVNTAGAPSFKINLSSAVDELSSCAAITEYGFVYSTSVTTPTAGGENCTKIVIGNENPGEDDEFSDEIANASLNTTYYVRSYATNLAGTAYSSVVSVPTGSAYNHYTISYKTNGKDEESTTIIYQGNAISDLIEPTPANVPAGYSFRGWYGDDYALNNSAPTFVKNGDAISGNLTLKAVFAIGTTSEGEFTKSYGFETASDDDWTIDGPARDNTNPNTGSYAGKINTNNTYVTFNNKVKVKEFSFAFTRASNNNNYNVYIETKTDNTAWAAAETYAMSGFNDDGTYKTKTKTFDGTTELYVRFHCSNTTAVRYVDDVTITYDAEYTTYSNYCTSVTDITENEYIDNEGKLTDDITISSGALSIESPITIPSGKTLTVEGTGVLVNTDPAYLIIEDGGQLYTESANVNATVHKTIAAWNTGSTDGWYFIASPINVNNLAPTNVTNMISDENAANGDRTYDLYSLDNITWHNYRANTFNLANGQGYLYASKDGADLQFSGAIKAYDANYTISVSQGWNLIGNPYTFEAYPNQAYYTINDANSGITAQTSTSSAVVAPCTGIIVKAAEDGTVKFLKDAPETSANNGNLQMVLAHKVATRDGASVNKNIDNAIVSFNEGSQLEKFYFGNPSASIFIPQNGEDYAIAFSDRQGDVPLYFKANETGTYTISFAGDEMSLNGIYLIDILAEEEIDLSVNPSYTFIGSPADRMARFKIVFRNTGGDGTSDIFAYQNGNDIIVSGEGELQIFDVTGRSVMTTTISGVETINVPTMGVYIFRLIGSEIKTQKIVVR